MQHNDRTSQSAIKYRTRESDKFEKKHTLNNNFLLKCSSSNSDSEPFYLHPPPPMNNRQRDLVQSSNKQQYYENNYYNPMPNDGIFVNPMRTVFTPPSPSESGESFFLHDPHEVIYNRVKDIFESDTSSREEAFSKKNAMTVKAEIHSSSSGTTSDEDTQELRMIKTTDKNNNNNNFVEVVMSNNQNSNHDYEDIYLVREEAKTTTSKLSSRSRSRDSGSHSRSASTSSTRSHEVIIQTKIVVS